MDKTEALTLCKKHMHRYVLVKTQDGMCYDGIVESVDNENLYLAVPGEDNMAAPMANHPYPGYGDQYRAFGPYGVPGVVGAPGYAGFPGYGPGFGPGYGFYGPRRRFRRLVLPLGALLALSLLPYF